jgi:hypothetical protein
MAFDTITKTFTGLPSTDVTCWCGIVFAIPRSLYNHYVAENDRLAGSYGLHCPLGHSFIPAGKSEAERLRDELAREKHRAEQAQAEARQEREWRYAANRATERAERRVAARKGVATRLKRKIAAGRCPCCSHQFKNLAQHMKVEHPKWDPERAADALEAKAQVKA